MAGGRRGPPPKPTRLKLLNANAGKHRLNTREPQPAKGTPRCPADMPPEGRKCWNRVAGRLRDMGLLTLAEREALESYAATYDLWKSCMAFIRSHGRTYPTRDSKGNITSLQQFPEVAIANRCALLLKAYQQELGLTPASRTRIQVPVGDEATDELRVFLGGKK